MNLVFPVSLEQFAEWQSFFPDALVFAKEIRSEKDWLELKALMQKNPLVSFAAVLDSFQPQLWHRIASSEALLVVKGVSVPLCMQAVQQKADVLLTPFLGNKALWDFSVLELAKQNGTEVAVLFSDVLNALPLERSKWFQQVFFLAFACRKKKVLFHVWSGARKKEEHRSEKHLSELKALLEKRF